MWCVQIQCAAGQIPGPNVPIGEDVLQQGTSGAEAADPQGEVRKPRHIMYEASHEHVR